MKAMKYLLVTCLSLLTACGEDRSDEFYSLIENRMWIEETMLNNYLWADDITPVTNENDYFQEPAIFFKNLLSKTALDGKGDKYSYMEIDPETTEEKTRSLTLDRTSTYGIEFMLTSDPTGTTNHTYARVLYTLPGSPAEEVGIRRGDWLCAIDGQRITTSNYHLLMNGGSTRIARMNITSTTDGITWQPADTLTLTPSVKMEINPFLIQRTYEIQGQRIAYLVYNEFSTGPENQGNENQYNTQMKQIFAQFKATNPNAFILDLRYNNGGFLQCAQALASLLAPTAALGQDFATLTFNPQVETPVVKYPLDPTNADANLNLGKVYILTTAQTASASEAVINGLIPYMGANNVILIGTRTEGKNVAMQSFRNDTYGLTLWPVVAYVSNAEGQGDYSDGFAPTYELDENCIHPWHPLGDPEEYLLKNTLALITTGTMPDLPENVSRSIAARPILQKAARPIVIPTAEGRKKPDNTHSITLTN